MWLRRPRVLIARKKFQVNRRNFHRVICRSMGNRGVLDWGAARPPGPRDG